MKAVIFSKGLFGLTLSADEVLMILAGLRESGQELEDWEFQTRTGFDREAMEKLHDSIASSFREFL
jgi:hypothetical protein